MSEFPIKQTPELQPEDLNDVDLLLSEIQTVATERSLYDSDAITCDERFIGLAESTRQKAAENGNSALETVLLSFSAGALQFRHNSDGALNHIRNQGILSHEAVESMEQALNERDRLRNDLPDETLRSQGEYGAVYTVVNNPELQLHSLERQSLLAFAVGMATVVKDPLGQNIAHSEDINLRLKQDVHTA